MHYAHKHRLYTYIPSLIASVKPPGILAVALGLLLMLANPVLALAPQSVFERGPVGREEFMRFAAHFAHEVKERVEAAREAFANLPADARADLLERYVERAVLLQVSAQMFPAFLAGRPLPTWEEFRQLGLWTENDLKDKITREVGQKFYFDALGDLMALLASQIVYDTSAGAAETAQWPVEKQRTAIWILLFNYFHMHNHLTGYELLRPFPDKEYAELETRPANDLVLRACAGMSTAAITWESFHDRPLVERLVKYTPPKRGAAAMQYAGRVYADLQAPHAWMCAFFNDRRRATDQPPAYPDVLRDVSESHDPAAIHGALAGLIKMHRLPAAEVMARWGMKGSKPLLAWLGEFAELFSEAVPPSRWEMGSAPVPYKDAQRSLYPVLTYLVERVPAGWQAYMTEKPVNHLAKMEQLIRHAFRNIHDGAPSHKKAQAVVWSAKDLGSISFNGGQAPGISGAENLTLMLVGIFAGLFDVHAVAMDDGSVEVKLDPLFTRWRGAELDDTLFGNLEACRKIGFLTQAPAGDSAVGVAPKQHGIGRRQMIKAMIATAGIPLADRLGLLSGPARAGEVSPIQKAKKMLVEASLRYYEMAEKLPRPTQETLAALFYTQIFPLLQEMAHLLREEREFKDVTQATPWEDIVYRRLPAYFARYNLYFQIATVPALLQGQLLNAPNISLYVTAGPMATIRHDFGAFQVEAQEVLLVQPLVPSLTNWLAGRGMEKGSDTATIESSTDPGKSLIMHDVWAMRRNAAMVWDARERVLQQLGILLRFSPQEIMRGALPGNVARDLMRALLCREYDELLRGKDKEKFVEAYVERSLASNRAHELMHVYCKPWLDGIPGLSYENRVMFTELNAVLTQWKTGDNPYAVLSNVLSWYSGPPGPHQDVGKKITGHLYGLLAMVDLSQLPLEATALQKFIVDIRKASPGTGRAKADASALDMLLFLPRMDRRAMGEAAAFIYQQLQAELKEIPVLPGAPALKSIAPTSIESSWVPKIGQTVAPFAMPHAGTPGAVMHKIEPHYESAQFCTQFA